MQEGLKSIKSIMMKWKKLIRRVNPLGVKAISSCISVGVLFCMLSCNLSVNEQGLEENIIISLTNDIISDYDVKHVYLYSGKRRLPAYGRDENFTESFNESFNDELNLKHCLENGIGNYKTSLLEEWSFDQTIREDGIIFIGKKGYDEILDKNREVTMKGIMTDEYYLNNIIFTYSDLLTFNCDSKKLYYIELKKKYCSGMEYFSYVFSFDNNKINLIIKYKDGNVF